MSTHRLPSISVEYRFSYRIPSSTAASDDEAVSVVGGRPPELTRTVLMSVMAAALLPVASIASACRRISSSFRRIDTDEFCAGHMPKPSVVVSDVGRPLTTGPARDGRPVFTLLV